MGNWKSRKAGTETETGTGTGTENWKRSSGAVLVCMQYIAWLLLTLMILEVVTIKGWLSVSTIASWSLLGTMHVLILPWGKNREPIHNIPPCCPICPVRGVVGARIDS